MSETQETVGIIRPEDVARKLAAIRNHERPEQLEQITVNPRLVELAWFIQYMSTQPGGLKEFSKDLAVALPQCIGTKTMRGAGNRAYSPAQKIAIANEIPTAYMPDLQEQTRAAALLSKLGTEELGTLRIQRAQRNALANCDAAHFSAICRRAVADLLPAFLESLCTDRTKGFDTRPDANTKNEILASELDEALYGDEVYRTKGKSSWWWDHEMWFMDDPIAAVLAMMDRRAGQVPKRLAMTAVSKKVFDALDYAMQERVMVRIEGDSRFGKTESLKTWCEMRPGLARLVKVPSSNSLSDLHRRIAEALGMEISYASRAQRLKERIEYVLQNSDLFLVLDEAAFLVPQSYTAATPPARLNWVRTEVVDRGLPLAVVVTPQSFLPAVNRFVKKTGYAMEQFFGRNYRTVKLPTELEEADMIAVARIHFAEMEDDYLAVVADFARLSENYLQAVEAIAKLARYIARRDKHRRVTIADIEAAASEIIPSRPAPPQDAPTAALDDRARRSAPAPARPGNGPLKPVSRGITPARIPAGDGEVLDSRSLRGAGRVKVETELVPVET